MAISQSTVVGLQNTVSLRTRCWFNPGSCWHYVRKENFSSAPGKFPLKQTLILPDDLNWAKGLFHQGILLLIEWMSEQFHWTITQRAENYNHAMVRIEKTGTLDLQFLSPFRTRKIDHLVVKKGKMALVMVPKHVNTMFLLGAKQ